MKTPEPSPSAASWLRKIFRHVAIDVTPLRESRDYRLLFIGQFVSAFGSAITYVVLPWQVYQLTKSTLLVGMLGLAEFFPMIILSLAGGALADAVDRRKLILGAECGLALCCVMLVSNALLPHPRVGILFFGAAWFAAVNAIHRPSLESLTPRLVAPEHLPAVSALASLRSFTFVVGPAVAGLIAATLGAATAFAVDLATYLVAIATLLLMRPIPAMAQAARPGIAAIAEALHYARKRPELLGTYLIDINAMFFAMPIALFPALAESFNGAAVGLFYSLFALGPLVVSLTSGWTARVERHGLAIIIAVMVWGLAIIGLGRAPNLWLALACILMAGAADGISGIFRMTIWNQTIPDRLRGRMASLEMVSYSTGPYLGNAQVGFTASLVGLRTGIACGGAACIAGAVLVTLLLPGFFRYDARAGVARKQREQGTNPPV